MSNITETTSFPLKRVFVIPRPNTTTPLSDVLQDPNLPALGSKLKCTHKLSKPIGPNSQYFLVECGYSLCE